MTDRLERYDPRIFRFAAVRQFLRHADAGEDILMPSDFAAALRDAIVTERYDALAIGDLCRRRGEKLEANGLENIYLGGCCQ